MATVQENDLFNRVPPQDLDAEKSTLGSVLLVNEMVDEVVSLIKPDHFYNDAHRMMFAAITDMYENGQRGIDTVTLANELAKRGQLEEVGGPGFLIEVLESVPHAAHAEYYARIVRDKWLQRSLIYTCTDILKETYEGSAETENILARAEQRVFQIAEQQEDLDKTEIKEILMDAWERICERSDMDGTISGVPSGFTGLDEMTSGFQPAELIVLAARPSMGKTAFVCNSGLAMARKSNCGVLMFSLEQSKLELAERFLCIHAKANGHKVRQGDLDEIERHALLEASNELGQYPIYIDDVAGRTMTQIGAVSRRMKRQYDIGCVVIDYLQLIEAEDKMMPREQQIASITRRLKFLSKELRIPVIALAQLNRGVEQREDKRPRLSDLRESGAIEQDADVVMFLHRPEAYDPEDRPGQADLIIAKNRSGPVGIVPLTWIKESLRFGDYSPIHEPEGGFV